MKIVYKDGSILICHEIRPIDSLHMIADEIYIVETDEVEIIEEGES